jgi:hypothetical protein
MIQRASLFLSFVLLSTSACTSSAPIESHVDERLEWFTAQTKAEVRAKAERHRIREQMRAEGRWVCEEGDWPQEWWDGCWKCGCDVGEVGGCTTFYCSPSERRRRQRQQQHPGPLPDPLTNVESVESVGSQVGKRLEKLTRRTKGELQAKADRHVIRERFRAAGAPVCEEGEWPQEWWDGCKWCWCDIKSQVRQCDWGPECDPEVERKLREQDAKDALEGELQAKANRHQYREYLRAVGARVCEEGEWPQKWWDGCKWCWCDIRSQVRHCEFGPECDPEVRRKLREQRALEERNRDRFFKWPPG